MERLAPHHRMTGVDHPGHGGSSQPGRAYRLHSPHVAFWENPERFSENVGDFLTGEA